MGKYQGPKYWRRLFDREGKRRFEPSQLGRLNGSGFFMANFKRTSRLQRWLASHPKDLPQTQSRLLYNLYFWVVHSFGD